MEDKSTRWTPESASAWLDSLLAEEPQESVDADLRSKLLRSCSLLAQFRLDGLRTRGTTVAEAGAHAALRRDLVRLSRIPGEPQWHTLKTDSRAEGLRLLGTLPEMRDERKLTALEGSGAVQQVFDEFLEGNYSAAESDDITRVEAALQVALWQGPYLVQVPPSAWSTTIEKRLAIRRLLYPMERLTRGFMGRSTELASLRSFVGVLEPETGVEAVRRFLSGFSSTRSPLMLYGIGGVGKSTLLAEFIRQHLNSPVPFPWVYLDFDNPRLNVAVLSTIVEEAVRQLKAQYAGSDWAALLTQSQERSLETEAASYSSELESHSLALQDVEQSDLLRQRNAQEIAESFALHLRLAMEGTSLERMMQVADTLPLLVVLDTFEEVQKRGVEMARILWEFLRALQEQFPRVRIVVAGRAPVPELSIHLAPPISLPLKDFDEGSAISFLMAREVTGEKSARGLYKQVGGNPLSLKLAAQVAKGEATGKSGIEGLKTSSYLIFAAAEQVIQGQLYQRILERIPGDDLQKLAHPGLVVRRVTERIIREVLAVPCGLGEIEEELAKDLFSQLRKQVDLVIEEPDGALRHQQDLRRVMLKMLETEKPQQVAEIHRGAYDFYENATETVGKIERIYHGLQLGKTDEVARIWIPEAAESLLSSVDELPPASRLMVYLLTKREPPAELRVLADQEQWERLVESKARQALQYGDFKLPQELLRERRERIPGSALYAIGALCSMMTSAYTAALDQLRLGIDSAQTVNRIDRLAELWRLRGDVMERLNRYVEADASFLEAQNLASRMGSPVLALQIYASRARLGEQAYSGPPPVEELNQIVRATGDSDFASVRQQLRGLFRICGPLSVPLLRKGLRVFTLQWSPSWPDIPLQSGPMDRFRSQPNQFFQTLMETNPDDQNVRSTLADILEKALNPNASVRMA